MTLFLIFYPSFIYWFLTRYRILLHIKEFKMRYSTMYVGINHCVGYMYMYYDNKSIYYLSLFLVRRLIFSAVVVFLTQNVQL